MFIEELGIYVKHGWEVALTDGNSEAITDSTKFLENGFKLRGIRFQLQKLDDTDQWDKKLRDIKRSFYDEIASYELKIKQVEKRMGETIVDERKKMPFEL